MRIEHAAEHVQLLDYRMRGQQRCQTQLIDEIVDGIYYTSFKNLFVQALDKELILVGNSYDSPIGSIEILLAITKDELYFGSECKQAVVDHISRLHVPMIEDLELSRVIKQQPQEDNWTDF